MTTPFTPSQIALARRICEAEWKKLFNRSCRYTMEMETPADWADRFLSTSLHPPGGPTPPWWQQAVAWADQGLVWVEGYGYMQETLWKDILEWTNGM